jgi:hypothetical protein
MEEQDQPADPSTRAAEEPPGPAPDSPGPPPPPATAEVPAAASYPPGYTPGTPPPPGPTPPAYGWTWGPVGPPGQPSPAPARSGGWFARFVRNALVAWVVAAALAAAVVGLSVSLASSRPAARVAPFGPAGTPLGRGGFAVPGPGGFLGSGVVGTVASVSGNSFTVNARSGQTVTVDEQSSTTYYDGATQATSSIVTQGATVAVQGSRKGSTVSATRVIVLPAGGLFGPPSSSG